MRVRQLGISIRLAEILIQNNYNLVSRVWLVSKYYETYPDFYNKHKLRQAIKDGIRTLREFNLVDKDEQFIQVRSFKALEQFVKSYKLGYIPDHPKIKYDKGTAKYFQENDPQ